MKRLRKKIEENNPEVTLSVLLLMLLLKSYQKVILFQKMH